MPIGGLIYLAGNLIKKGIEKSEANALRLQEEAIKTELINKKNEKEKISCEELKDRFVKIHSLKKNNVIEAIEFENQKTILIRSLANKKIIGSKTDLLYNLSQLITVDILTKSDLLNIKENVSSETIQLFDTSLSKEFNINQFVEDLKKINKLYELQIFTTEEYIDRKERMLKSLDSRKLNSSGIDLLTSLIPLKEENILSSKDFDRIKQIVI